MEIGIGDWGFGLQLRFGIRDWGSGLKLVYRLKITFELELYLIDCGAAESVRKM